MNSPLVWIAVLALVSLMLMPIDWRPGHYKIGYRLGAKTDLSTKMLAGILVIGPETIEIKGPTNLTIPLADIRDLNVRPFQGMRRFYRLSFGDSQLSFAVVRFMIGGWFVQGDYFKATRLEKELAARGIR